MEIQQRKIQSYGTTPKSYRDRCRFCDKEPTDEVVMNGHVNWLLCLEHKQNYDLVLAFQDLIQS